MRLRYGTRGSALALAQSGLVARQLEALGASCERVVIQTSGDRFSATVGDADVDLSAGAEAPNVKAMFVKEIEDALLRGDIDFAVHSSKDLPGVLPEGLVVACFPRREDPRDVYIGSPRAPSLASFPDGARLATSSLRRRIQLAMAKPRAAFVPMRGNVDTRLRKLGEGAADGLILAAAGLNRLGRTEIPAEPVPTEVVTPAPGQGALALETRAQAREAREFLQRVEDPATRLAVDCERAVMEAVGGDCRTPLGAYARIAGDTLTLEVFWAMNDGSRPVRAAGECPARRESALDLAKRLSERVRSRIC
ncbi:MAG: hydroxymethylbilane synthase [Elusimicrobia bacterium]|nr:hydroxymethylbilane synthase [Elusimicrobiota bacterium]